MTGKIIFRRRKNKAFASIMMDGRYGIDLEHLWRSHLRRVRVSYTDGRTRITVPLENFNTDYYDIRYHLPEEQDFHRLCDGRFTVSASFKEIYSISFEEYSEANAVFETDFYKIAQMFSRYCGHLNCYTPLFGKTGKKKPCPLKVNEIASDNRDYPSEYGSSFYVAPSLDDRRFRILAELPGETGRAARAAYLVNKGELGPETEALFCKYIGLESNLKGLARQHALEITETAVKLKQGSPDAVPDIPAQEGDRIKALGEYLETLVGGCGFGSVYLVMKDNDEILWLKDLSHAMEMLMVTGTYAEKWGIEESKLDCFSERFYIPLPYESDNICVKEAMMAAASIVLGRLLPEYSFRSGSYLD